MKEKSGTLKHDYLDLTSSERKFEQLFFLLFVSCIRMMPGENRWRVKRFVWKVDESPIVFNQHVFAEHFTKLQNKSDEKALDAVTRSRGLHFMNLIHTFIVLAHSLPPQSPPLYFLLLLSLHQSSHWNCNLWDTQTFVKWVACLCTCTYYKTWFVLYSTHVHLALTPNLTWKVTRVVHIIYI